MKPKRLSIVCITLALAALLFLVPCQGQAQQNTIELKIAFAHPATHVAQVPNQEWIKNVEERTGGKVKIKAFWGTLGKVTDFYDMVKNGVVDVVVMGTGWSAGRMPICEIIDLPFEVSNIEIGEKVLEALYSQGLLKELDPFKVLSTNSMITGNLFLTNKKVTKLEELSGMKIRPIPGVSTKLVEVWKAVPVAVRTPDLYMALQKGQIDGMFTGPDNFVGQKLYEVCKYQLKIPTFNGAFVTLMNKNTWNKLPPDIQSTIEQVSEEIDDFRLNFFKKLAGDVQAVLDKEMKEVYSLSPAEEARWKKAAENVTEQWIAEMESKGLPGREAVKIMRSIAGK